MKTSGGVFFPVLIGVIGRHCEEVFPHKTATCKVTWKVGEKNRSTLPETNMAPENQWLEEEFPFGMACFQGRTVRLRDGNKSDKVSTPKWQNVSTLSIFWTNLIRSTQVAKTIVSFTASSQYPTNTS